MKGVYKIDHSVKLKVNIVFIITLLLILSSSFINSRFWVYDRDNERFQDLTYTNVIGYLRKYSAAKEIEIYVADKEYLPKNLKEVKEYICSDFEFESCNTNLEDPKTGEFYEYFLINNNSFKICANFETDGHRPVIEPRKRCQTYIMTQRPSYIKGKLRFDINTVGPFLDRKSVYG